MKYATSIVFKTIISFCLLFVSCDQHTDEPALHTHVSFINESQHTVSVVFNGIASWCTIDDFELKPEEKIEYDYEGLGIEIFEATVTFDENVLIVHKLNDNSHSDVFRNICETHSSSWEYEHYEKAGNHACFTYRFLDSDYYYAANLNSID